MHCRILFFYAVIYDPIKTYRTFVLCFMFNAFHVSFIKNELMLDNHHACTIIVLNLINRIIMSGNLLLFIDIHE